jgi:RNA polymerase sigma-70 factor (ECF subfamily)
MGDAIRDDLDLLRACAKGDDQALGSLYDRHGEVAYRVALRVLRDPALAEDAVQEAFLGVWRQAATYDPARGKASTWILTLVHRRAVDIVRRRARSKELAAPPLNAVEGVDEAVGRRSDVQAALCTLSAPERQVLDLAYWRGLTQSEIATALGMPVGTVKSRTFNALAKLGAALSVAPCLAAVLC